MEEVARAMALGGLSQSGRTLPLVSRVLLDLDEVKTSLLGWFSVCAAEERAGYFTSAACLMATELLFAKIRC